jgi:hypothetical protein
MSMVWYSFPLLIAGLGYFVIAFLLFLKSHGRINHASRIFAFFNICLGIWALGVCGLYLSPNLEIAKIFHKYLMFGLLFIFSTFYHFVLEITENRHPRNRFFLKLAYFFSALFLLSSFFDFYWSGGLTKYRWGYNPVIGPISQIYNLVFLFYVISGMRVLWLKIKQEQLLLKKNQLIAIYYSFLVIYISSTTAFLPVLGIDIYPIGNIFYIFSTIIIAYAILKYQTFDLFIVLRKSIFYTLFALFIIVLYFTLLMLWNGLFLKEAIHFSLVDAVIFSVLMLIGVKWMDPLLERLTNRFFHRKKQNLLNGLEKIGKEAAIKSKAVDNGKIIKK